MGLPVDAVREVVRRALAEDAAGDDVTTRWSVPASLDAEALVRAKEPGTVAGLPVAAEVFRQVDPALSVRPAVADGDPVAAGDPLLAVHGSARAIITGERTALNFLQRMCGIATQAAAFVAAVAGLPVRVLDTRKTAPGLRLLDKYAVVAGGAANHRRDLAAMVLLKENHLAAAGGITAAIKAVRDAMAAEGRDLPVDVEVETVEEAEEALRAGASWLMLDNMPAADMCRVVELRAALAGDRQVTLEASGNVTLDTVRTIAATGVDAVSVGALTHSVRALDLTLLLAAAPAAPEDSHG
ncbi:MAG: carboxylating nicotinate-nucleotide diphosphorylase [Mycobacteriales bacterium]